MTYPIWSGINTGFFNDVEINGAALTPDLTFDGFNADIVPVHLGGVDGLYAEVMYARMASPQMVVPEESVNWFFDINPNIEVLPELRMMGKERSQKEYP